MYLYVCPYFLSSKECCESIPYASFTAIYGKFVI